MNIALMCSIPGPGAEQGLVGNPVQFFLVF